MTKDEIDDLKTFCAYPPNKKKCFVEIENFLKISKNLEDAARLSSEIIEELSCKAKVANMITEKFISYLIANKKQIKNLLNSKSGDKLLDKVPSFFIVDLIELYDIKLNRKHALFFLEWLQKDNCAFKIPKLLELTKLTNIKDELEVIICYDTFKENLIKLLIKKKDYKTIRKIPNLKQILSSKTMEKEISHMMIASANHHFKTDGWEYLEEIFQKYPEVIGICINNANGKFLEKNLKGIVSICERNEHIYKLLSGKAKGKVLAYKQDNPNEAILPNELHFDEFAPSNSEKFFSFKEFGVEESQIIWIDDKCNEAFLKETKERILSHSTIFLDTESTVARTPLQLDDEVLALIQFSSGDNIYIVDTYNAKNPIIATIFKEFLSNPEKTVIGHTVFDDVGAVANFFEVGKYKCKVIDIKDGFGKLSIKGCGMSLKAISQNILGKEICKKYTLTNWEKRPLRKSQIHYAALDAYIIEKIWEKLKPMIDELEVKNLEVKKLKAENKNKKETTTLKTEKLTTQDNKNNLEKQIE